VATVRARIALILGIATSALAAAASADPLAQTVQLETRRGSARGTFARPRYSKTGNDRDGGEPKSEVHSVPGLAVDARRHTKPLPWRRVRMETITTGHF